MKKNIIYTLTIAACVVLASCKDKDVYYYEDAATLDLSYTEPFLFPQEGGKITVDVKTNRTDWEAVSDQEWLVVDQGENSFTLTALANDTPSNMPTATVTVTAGSSYNNITETMTVYQAGLTPATLTVFPDDDMGFVYGGGTREFGVETNQSTWDVTSDQTWCVVNKEEDYFTVTVAANDGTASREQAKITVRAGAGNNIAEVILTADQEGKPDFTGIDLGINGTANSYIVSSPGDYFFTATVQGNGAVTIDIVPERMNPASAELLWQDYYENGIGLVKSVSLEQGYVRFSTYDQFNHGNALIAVKDTSGKIIWSWHLWFVSDLKDQEWADATNDNAPLYSVLDRNLGANSATPGDDRTMGLGYQWGRKDPFPAPADISGSGTEGTAFLGKAGSGAGTSYTYDIHGTVNNSTSNMIWQVGTVLDDHREAIATPTTFYSQLSSTLTDWLTEPADYLWGNPCTETRVITGYTGTNFTVNSENGSKSIYDPCPVGYRVMPSDSWARTAIVRNETAFYDAGAYGWELDITTNGEKVWVPLAGYRWSSAGDAAGKLYSQGSAGFSWTSSPYREAGTSTSNATKALTISISSSSFTSLAANGIRARAVAVRCSRE